MTEVIAGIQVLFGFIIFPILIALLTVSIGTAINFIPSFYIARYLKNRVPYFKYLVFVIVFSFSALVLHLNYRIPGILKDFSEGSTESINITHPIYVHIGSPISININHEFIEYKPKYLESTWLGDYSYSFKNLNLKRDHFIFPLEQKGLKIQRNKNAPIKITGFVKKTSTHNLINMKVIENGEIVAEYSNKFRVTFAGEHSKNILIQLALTLMQSTPTRFLFPDFWRDNIYLEPPVTGFLEQVFQVTPKPERLSSTEYTVTSFNKRPDVYLLHKNALNTKREFCARSNKRIIFSDRFVTDNRELEGQKRQVSGKWISIREDGKLYNKKYLQAPNITKYQSSFTHYTYCDAEFFTVMVSFMGVDMSKEKWGSLFARTKSKNIGKYVPPTPEEKKVFRDEYQRVKAINDELRNKYLRNVWILRYSYDAELEEAVNFILPENSPEYVSSISKVGPDEWNYSGFDIETRKENNRFNRYKLYDYNITIRNKDLKR